MMVSLVGPQLRNCAKSVAMPRDLKFLNPRESISGARHVTNDNFKAFIQLRWYNI
jgi:hypothetical protein